MRLIVRHDTPTRFTYMFHERIFEAALLLEPGFEAAKRNLAGIAVHARRP